MSEPQERRSPYLTVVATSRNDNHGGDLLKRMQLFITCLAAQANRHKLPIELIMVEWNPPSDRPPLLQALEWPSATRFFGVRIITVPPEVHGRLDHSDGLPMFQMIAKNVGIRRARGTFVLATNIDLIFPDALWLRLKEGLTPGLLYRNDRLDVSREIPSAAPIDDLLRFCEHNVLRQHRARGTFLLKNGRWTNTTRSAFGICKHHLRVWSSSWYSATSWVMHDRARQLRFKLEHKFAGKRWFDTLTTGPIVRFVARTPWLRKPVLALGAVAFGWLLLAWYRIKHRRAPDAFKPVSARSMVERACQLLEIYRANRLFIKLHTNGCGDFTLLDRETWFRLRGYPEWPIFSWTLDSMFLFHAYANGVPARILPIEQCCYHIDHGGGWTPEEAAKLFNRLAEKGVPVITEQRFYELRAEMAARKRRGEPLLRNEQDWGFADMGLPEIRISRDVGADAEPVSPHA